MIGSVASFRRDKSCALTDSANGTEVVWPTVMAWADQWHKEWQADEFGDASEFIHDACDRALPGVVRALVILAQKVAGNDEFLGWVGAGPLEGLLSHSGNGPSIVDDVEKAARMNAAFRTALGNVWLGTSVPETVKDRLAVFGVRAADFS